MSKPKVLIDLVEYQRLKSDRDHWKRTACDSAASGTMLLHAAMCEAAGMPADNMSADHVKCISSLREDAEKWREHSDSEATLQSIITRLLEVAGLGMLSSMDQTVAEMAELRADAEKWRSGGERSAGNESRGCQESPDA